MRGRISLWTGTALVLATLAAAGIPAQSQVWTGAGSADDLRYRLGVIDAELADIRARIGGAPAADTGFPAGGAGGDLAIRLDRLEAELRQLTGKVEQLEFEQRRIAEDATRRFGDIEFRLTELEGGDTSQLGQPVPVGGGVDVTPTPEVSVSERSDLDRAIDDVKKGRFDQGEDRLRSFLTTYPGSPLEAEAYYWLGESQFVRGSFQNAARNYLSGYNINRSSVEAPRNLYRLGVTLGRLGQINEACLTLREVGRQYPAAPAEVLAGARDEAGKLNCG